MSQSAHHVCYEGLQEKCHGWHAYESTPNAEREHEVLSDAIYRNLTITRLCAIWVPWNSRGTVRMDDRRCGIWLILKTQYDQKGN